MPQNFVSDDNETETRPFGSESQQEEDTSFAENNDANSSVSSPLSDENEENAEVLRANLKRARANQRDLGTVAKRAAEVLIQKALNGDEQAKNTISATPEFTKYAQQSFPKDYEKIFQKPEDTAQVVYQRIKEEQRDDQIKAAIRAEGIKGEEDFDKIFATAKGLPNFSVDNAVSAAITAVKGRTAFQPRMSTTRTQIDTPIQMSDSAQELARGFGLTAEDIKKYGKS